MVYVEPVAVVLSRKSGHPVKIMMSREDVFRATGPTSGSSMTVKIGVKRDGKIVAADGLFKFQAGAFPGSPVMNACMCAFAPYDIANARAVGYDVVCNRPKVAAYRAPGSPISAFAVESVIDMLRAEDRHGPAGAAAEERRQDRARQMLVRREARARRLCRDPPGAAWTIPATRCRSARTRAAASPSGYWFNGGGESSATVQVNDDGTVVVATGSPDIGGSRASMAIMAAETLGVDYDQVRADRRRHRFGRLHARDRRLARDLRDRHGRGQRDARS